MAVVDVVAVVVIVLLLVPGLFGGVPVLHSVGGGAWSPNGPSGVERE